MPDTTWFAIYHQDIFNRFVLEAFMQYSSPTMPVVPVIMTLIFITQM